MNITATTSPEQAAQGRWDAIVIGAGPAGAFAARGLAQRNLKTLLLDRKPFPRSKVCGACVSHHALALIQRAGLSDPLQRLPRVPLTRLQVRTLNNSLEVALPEGAAISRTDLDEMFLRAAITEGADFLPETTALVEPAAAEGHLRSRRVNCTDSHGRSFELETSAIVAADGLGHPSLRNCREFADHVRPHSRVGLGATLATNASGFESGEVTMAVGKPGYVGAVRLKDGRLHLAASVDHSALRQFTTPAKLIASIFSEARLPAVSELFNADWQGTRPLTRRSSQVAERRIFLAGDAAGYVEPFTGEGIAWAITTGLAVPGFIQQAVEQNAEAAARGWQNCYRQLIQHRQDWCRVLAWMLRRPRLAASAVRLMKFVPAVPRFLIHQIHHPIATTEWDFA